MDLSSWMWPMQADREEVVFGEDVYWLLTDVTYFVIEECTIVKIVASSHAKSSLTHPSNISNVTRNSSWDLPGYGLL